jgi:hypothetical protein
MPDATVLSIETAGRGPMSLWRSAGVLAIIGGAALAIWVLWMLLELTLVDQIAYLLPGGLVIAGGVLALQGRRAVAPWLILAGCILRLILPVLVPFGLGGGFLLPWDLADRLTTEIEFWGLLGGVTMAMADLSIYFMVIAAVLAIIAFSKTPARAPSATPAIVPAHTVRGVASVSVDGTVAANWYADPEGKPAERFWDGSAWTDKTRPVTTATAQPFGVGVSKPTITPTGEPISPNSRSAAAILCFFLGALGIHRFYVGKVGTGIAMIFTLGGLGIWSLIDFIWILVGTFKDKTGRILANW